MHKRLAFNLLAIVIVVFLLVALFDNNKERVFYSCSKFDAEAMFPKSKVAKAAIIINDVYKSKGMLGLIEEVEMCYSKVGDECILIDSGAFAVNSSFVDMGYPVIEYFSSDKFYERVNKVSKKFYNVSYDCFAPNLIDNIKNEIIARH